MAQIAWNFTSEIGTWQGADPASDWRARVYPVTDGTGWTWMVWHTSRRRIAHFIHDDQTKGFGGQVDDATEGKRRAADAIAEASKSL